MNVWLQVGSSILIEIEELRLFPNEPFCHSLPNGENRTKIKKEKRPFNERRSFFVFEMTNEVNARAR